MCWLNKPYRLWSYIFVRTSFDSCPEAPLSIWIVQSLKLLWTLQNTTLNDFVLTQLSWISHPAASFLHISVLSINPAVISSPKKLLPTFQSIFCKMEWQDNSALFIQPCRQRTDFLMTWSTIQTCLFQIQGSFGKLSLRIVGSNQVVSRFKTLIKLKCLLIKYVKEGRGDSSNWLRDLKHDTVLWMR